MLFRGHLFAVSVALTDFADIIKNPNLAPKALKSVGKCRSGVLQAEVASVGGGTSLPSFKAASAESAKP